MPGEVYEEQITTSDTTAHAVESAQKYLKFGVIYVDTQNCYIGDKDNQRLLLEACSPVDMSKALPLVNVDLATLYYKAATSGSVVHIVGTLQ